jgi:hypothetical protein
MELVLFGTLVLTLSTSRNRKIHDIFKERGFGLSFFVLILAGWQIYRLGKKTYKMRKDQFQDKFRHLNVDQRELDRKYQAYIREQQELQMMYEAAMSLQSSTSTVGGGGGSGGFDGVLTLTVDSSESLSTTDWCFTQSAPTTFSVDWGDGVIEEYEGNDCIDHTYAEAGIWNVVITFANPALITEIDFND